MLTVRTLAGESKLPTFIAAWTEPLLNQSGWLHIREEIRQEGLALGLLPDGRPIPASYILDAWCLTGQDGMVTEAVVEMYDLDGERVQASVFTGHEWTNVTFQITFPGEPFRPSLDHGISESIANRADGRISGFGRSESSHSGRPVVEISTFEAFTEAIRLEGYALDVEQITNRAVFDAHSHGLGSFETTYRSEDGLEKTVARVLVLAVERVDEPPDAILSLLREVSQ